MPCSYGNQNCSACGSTPDIQQLFTYQNGSCYVTDCQTIGNLKNGWICNSCYNGDQQVTSGQYFDGTNCVNECPQGQQAGDFTSYICEVVNQGQGVGCDQGDQNCDGCGQNDYYTQQFTYNNGVNQCQVTNCSTNGVRFLNGYVCNSCSTASGSGNIPKGKFYDHKTCTDTCPSGYKADQSTGFVCQAPPNPGTQVQCSQDSQTCNGCGNNPDTVNMFKHVSGQNCSVIDCHQYAFSASVNGWICKSCALATGSDNIPQGEYYDENADTCVKSCPIGTSASANTDYLCRPVPVAVPCSNDSSTCKGCGSDVATQGYFNYVSGNNCIVQDCTQATKFNGWVCNSCSFVNAQTPFQGKYYNGSSCTDNCPPGQSASAATGYTCQVINPGVPVACSKDAQTCGGCGSTSDIQNLFSKSKGNLCEVTDCSSNIIGSNLNGWICNSCQNASGSGNIAAGQYFDGKTCVKNCPPGQQASADTGFVCQYPPSPGTSVACSTDSSTCGGCGTTNSIQNLFTHGKGNLCSVTDCNLSVIGSNLNGWVCNSCQNASGGANVAAGQYFDGKTCVKNCPIGQQASVDTGFVCQNPPNPGASVTCSTDSSTCAGCGATNTIQNLFTHGQGNICSVTDCKLSVVGSNLNGWVCNSCQNASGGANVAAGQYFDGKTCVKNCPIGQQASVDTGFVCQNPPNPGASVTCSTDSSTCAGCGATNTIQNLFTHGQGNICSVTDCKLSVVGSNLNGWVCKSCSSASGSSNIPVGQYYDGKTCVADCPSGQSATADTGYVCKPLSNPASGNNNQSTASNASLITFILGFAAILNLLF
ncbi:hypothetical protein TTHERM_00634650 (macronuclear) [Tetrahymena thermophila SB210]|uniref:Immobilization antigen n=1 Tax=Tetrahymena thermophila (strain SB210) TaxID=312017 RepID=Q22WY7_TETTS|nr:hypothetical protein TTHERM_00634650 [Tetrahymena thermophila SB210]EAR89859.1 hypothetical protein TTHERM_00634650 [Tetrahymena thermophila SB210]|eukprot:XP_001010104.1 hypothetical protein TTHERM_00634650 [Tetrahymena thermophila SB210]